MGWWCPYVTVASPATALAAKDEILAVALVVEVVLAGQFQADFRSQSIRRRRGMGVAKVRHLCPRADDGDGNCSIIARPRFLYTRTEPDSDA